MMGRLSFINVTNRKPKRWLSSALAAVRRLFFRSLLKIVLLVVVGCQSAVTQPAPEGEQKMALELTSSAFDQGGTIPQKYTCDGVDVSPPLTWSGVPNEAQSLALIADDPDAPRGTWVHWVLFNISPDQDGLSEGIQGVGTGGRNDFGKPDYGGPCPPSGPAHRYFFKLYALDIELNLSLGATKADVEAAMQGHILAQGELMGKYGR